MPPWSQWGELVAANRQWRDQADVELSGRSLAELAAVGRQELAARARRYVSSYAGNGFPEPDGAGPLVLTGHQPGFEHPGVWLKNFAAGAVADAVGGTAVHLVIDGDVCRSAAIFVPAGDVGNPHLAPVEFDRASEPLPWEERRLIDAECWRSFPERVHEVAAGLVRGPMLGDWWPTAVARGEGTGALGVSLAQARHLAEIQWGRRNLELPQSVLCQTVAFRWFVGHVLKNLPRFAAAYNESIADFRREHRIRNHAHPVPALGRDGDWTEAPLWLWTVADPRRRAVFARPHRDGAWITDRGGFERLLPIDAGNGEATVEALSRWEAEGLKLRSRALVTTMFARLVLADLFIHGLGGARYDEATDAICVRFFGVAPPRFATLSGTLHLPIEHPPGDEADVGRWHERLRELRFHPEVRIRLDHLDPSNRAAAEAAAADKLRWISTAKTPTNAEARHLGITGANAELQRLVDAQRHEAEAQVAASIDRARANRVLNSREFAFCLYPRNLLEQFLLAFDRRAL